MNKPVWSFFLLPLIVMAACTGGATVAPTPQPAAATSSRGPAATTIAPTVQPTPPAGTQINRRVDVPDDISYPQYVPFDGILPIYDPAFVPASDTPIDDDELVLVASLGNEAKAYPITVLRTREMVNDELGGIPILVTW